MARLLVVDDDRNLLLLYREELTDEGHKADLARSAREALDIFEEIVPDLVIAEDSIPGMEGVDALAKDKGVPMILSTAYGAVTDDKAARPASARGVKSCDLGELKAKVREALENRGKGAGTPR